VKFEDQEVNRSSRIWTTAASSGSTTATASTNRSGASCASCIRQGAGTSAADHPIYRTAYDLPLGLPKIHEHDGKPPQGYGIFSKGRLVIFYTYETDIGAASKDEGVHPENTPEKREEAMKMALNILFYALSQ
jgi:hypothetical protein